MMMRIEELPIPRIAEKEESYSQQYRGFISRLLELEIFLISLGVSFPIRIVSAIPPSLPVEA
jgi:hypothetical protein